MKKLLLVEDDNNIRENLEILLKSAGYFTVSAENGLEGLKCLDNFSPDLIISDIMMPYLNGFEFFQNVTNKLRIIVPPFIFLTAKSDLTSMRHGMNLGADDYLTKPFKFTELLQAVESRLKKQDIIALRMNSIRENVSSYVHHELRTPLVAILGYSDIILTDHSLNKEEIIEMIEKVKLAAHRLHDRITKMILVAEIRQFDLGNSDNFKSDFNVPFLKSIISGIKLPKPRLEQVYFQIETAILKASDELISILLSELLENAFKFSITGKIVQVVGAIENNTYSLNISNYGRSITSEEIDSIKNCNPKDSGKFKMNSINLGLVLVGKSLEIMNGSISFESSNNATIVKLTLPMAV